MYPEAANLPFNATVLKNEFVPLHPGDPAAEDSGYWIVLKGQAVVVEEHEGSFSLWQGERPHWVPAGEKEIILGMWRGKPLRAIRIPKEVVPPPPYIVEPFNSSVERLDDRLLSLGGIALQAFHWQRISRLCSICGGEFDWIPLTWGKRCKSCGYEHFPHIHPCIIVLVRRGEQMLLTRKPEWPQGRYSLVAGFLDMGESLEECVHREVKEETGIEVTNIRYVGSQNWPFPSQVMAGFVADYAGGEVVVDKSELEDARWFSKTEMPASLPVKRSIARWIIERYGLELV